MCLPAESTLDPCWSFPLENQRGSVVGASTPKLAENLSLICRKDFSRHRPSDNLSTQRWCGNALIQTQHRLPLFLKRNMSIPQCSWYPVPRVTDRAVSHVSISSGRPGRTSSASIIFFFHPWGPIWGLLDTSLLKPVGLLTPSFLDNSKEATSDVSNSKLVDLLREAAQGIIKL